jgi:hypothetical protein
MLAQSLFDLPFVAQLNPVATTAVTSASLWADRVVVNGGTRPTDNTITAMNTFYNSLVSSGIDSKMISVCCFVPDNFTAAITPLINKAGNDPWTPVNLSSSNLGINGITGSNPPNPVSSYLKTGANPATCYASNDDGGFTIYTLTPASYPRGSMISTDGVHYAGVYTDGTAIRAGLYQAWSLTQSNDNTTSGSNNNFTFCSVSRTSAISLALYEANSIMGFLTRNTGADLPGARPNFDVWLNCWNNAGSPINFPSAPFVIYSFAAIHNGLTAIETQDFYNAVQTLRISLGGGYA